MNPSRPVGSLGGGGWESDPPGAGYHEKKKEDKVLADMYEMFLDTLEPEIIQNVVHSFNFHHKKSMDALLDMCGGKDSSPAVSPSQNKKRPSTLSLNVSRNTSSEKDGSNEATSQRSLIRVQDEKRSASRNSTPPPLSSILSASSHEGKRQRPPRNMPNRVEAMQTFPQRDKKGQDHFANNRVEKIRCLIENGQRVMIFMRGVPGSGKSFLARGIIEFYGGKPQDYVFSTDDYFIRNGVYTFDPSALNDAHQWNHTRVLAQVRKGWSPIIIDNTNTQMWEMITYANIAINNGYIIEVLEPETTWFRKIDELCKRNRHGVPRDKIRLMLDRYECGITADAVIQSVGARYLKPVPQAAEHSLVVQKPFRCETPGAAAPLNHKPSLGRKEQTSSSESLTTARRDQHSPRYSPSANTVSNEYSSRPKEIPNTAPTSSPTSAVHGDFYFGPNASNPNLDSFQSSSITALPRERGNTLLQSNVKGQVSLAPDLLSQKQSKELRAFSDEFKVASKELDNSQNSNASAFGGLTSGCSSGSKEENEFSPSIDVLRAAEIRKSEPETPARNKNLAIASLFDIGSWQGNVVKSENSKLDLADSKEQILEGANAIDPEVGSSLCDRVSDSNSNSRQRKDENSSSQLSFSPLINFTSTSNVASGNTFSFSPLRQASDVPPSLSSPNWVANWQREDNTKNRENPEPKIIGAFSLKSVEDYCNSIKDLDATSQSKDLNLTSDIGWSICENNSASWQPIDKLQEDVLKKENSNFHDQGLNNFQRLKFIKCEVVDKATNTHHADFCLLSSNEVVGDAIVLDAHDRDINKGRSFFPSKVPVKLMLDKGTITENDFEGEPKDESRQEKIQELVRLFPNSLPASIKEILKQCKWNVNYASNILLDASDFSTEGNALGDDDNNSVDSEEEKQDADDGERMEAGIDGNVEAANNSPDPVVDLNEKAKVKRHIERSIDFDERCYSSHTLAIKNFRRGMREGAIPKSHAMLNTEPTVLPAESTEVMQEFSEGQTGNTSDSSGGDDETLEFILGHDFIQQLVDKFGDSVKVNDISPVVKFPVSLARQIYVAICSGNVQEEEDDDGDFAMKLQCEEDEKMARQLYQEMMNNPEPKSDLHDAPKLREIMDMELAQAIYKADVDLLTQNSHDTMAKVLAKRLLEENYSQIDKKTLNDIFASCNYSFEDTVKTLQEHLSTDNQVLNPYGSSLGIQQGRAASKMETSNELLREKSPQKKCPGVEESIGIENPWEINDPSAYYEKYREKAEQFLKERDEMYRKASDAFRRKERSAAAYYSKLGELIGKKYHHANSLAAAALAATHTDSHSSETLDLHHFKVVEAVNVFDLFLDYHIRNLSEHRSQLRCLDIITGRGTHSVNGRPRIKPAVISRAKKRNIKFQTLSNNPGVLKVWVAVNSLLSHEIHN